jgi:hypothetical protein
MMTRLSLLLALSALALACNKPVTPPEDAPKPAAVDAGVLTPDVVFAKQIESLPWSADVLRSKWKAGVTLGYEVNADPLKCATTLKVVSCANDNCAMELDRSACGTPVAGPAKGVQNMPLAQAVLAGATIPLGTKSADWKFKACNVMGKDTECMYLESLATGTTPGETEVLRTLVLKDTPVVVEHLAGIQTEHELKPMITLRLTSMTGF